MAKPIQSTPVLKGRDAFNFLTKVEQNKDKKVDKATLDKIREDAKKIQEIFRPK